MPLASTSPEATLLRGMLRDALPGLHGTLGARLRNYRGRSRESHGSLPGIRAGRQRATALERTRTQPSGAPAKRGETRRGLLAPKVSGNGA